MQRPGVRARLLPWLPLALLCTTLTLYCTTLAPGVLGGDPGEYQFVPYILSMPHPTGTPLYILLSKLWSALPLGPSVAWRLNLLGAISASLAVVMLYQCAYLLTRRAVPALAAALLFALGATFWEQATMADKYAFNAFMLGLVLYLALRWGRAPTIRGLELLALGYGLSLAHHRTMALLALPLLGYVWWYERAALWRDWRRLLRLVLLLCLPLLLYLYLPWAVARDLPPGQWQPRTWLDWIVAMYDEGWIREIRVVPGQQNETMGRYGQVLLHDFGLLALPLALAGLLLQVRRRLPDAIFLLLVFLPQAILAANYHVPRRWVFFLPSFFVYALWLAGGLGWAWDGVEWLCARWGARAVRVATTALAVVMLALPLALLPDRYGSFREAHLGAGVLDIWRQELKWGAMGERLGRAIAAVEPGAAIVCDWEQATPLWYYQYVEGWRPDVEIVYPMERLEEAAAGGRPLYIARTQPGLADRWHPSCEGPLLALHEQPVRALPAGLVPLGLRLGESLELTGFVQGEADLYPGTVLPLTLYWRAVQAPAFDYSVSLRLYDGQGHDLARVDSQHPALGTYPTSLWAAGEVVGDYYEIQLPAGLAPGSYQWGVLVYRTLPEGGWLNLKVAGTDQELASGGTIVVQAR
jgi:hypothetical protein